MVSNGNPGSGLHNGCTIRFGEFEYDSCRRELRKHGLRVRLQNQPLAILLALTESPGVVVSREELCARIWGSDTFVEFEQGLNSAIKRLRDTLADSAEQPRYIETIPGEGYRFIGEVKSIAGAKSATPISTRKNGRHHVNELAIPRWRQGWWMQISTIAGICVVATILAWLPVHRATTPLGMNAWVLVTRFDNRTGEAQFDNVLDFALRNELSNSHVVHVAALERIQDTLRLMRKPLDTPVDEQTGREICMRDGGVGGLITGRVEKIGSGYVLTASLVDARTGTILLSVSAEAHSSQAVLTGVNRLSNQLREKMGEALGEISKSDMKLEKVTTPSIHALQLFSQGAAVLVADDDQSAAQLFSQAISIDPEFASAYAYRGWAMNGAGAIASFRRAKELADTASERERLFILQSWYAQQLQDGDLEAAIHYGQLLTKLYPDFYLGVATQAYLDMMADHPDQAAVMYDQALRLRPNAFALAQTAWWSFTYGSHNSFRGFRPDLAHVFEERAENIAARSGDPGLTGFWVPFIEASRRCETDDVPGTMKALDAARPEDASDMHKLVVAYLSVGRLHKAEELIPSTGGQEQLEMLATFLRTGVAGLRTHIRPHPASELLPGGIINLLYARVGGLGREDAMHSMDGRPLGWQRSWQSAIQGEEAINRKRFGIAIGHLRDALKWSNSPTQQLFLADSLATALEHERDQTGAAAVLEPFAGAYGDALCFDVFRPLVLEHLARIYRREGDAARATALENRVKKLLAVADADYSLDAQLGAVSPAAHDSIAATNY